MLRSLLLVAITALGQAVAAQTLYIWSGTVDPAWTSVNTGSGSPLIWQSACHVVSTQCNGNYDGNQNTSYTSSTMNTTYMYANSVQISYNIKGNTESADTLYASYSLNGGTTWQHAQIHAGSNYSTLSTIIFTIPTSNNFKFRFKFVSDNGNNKEGYALSNFKVAYYVALPVELSSFSGKNMGKSNVLSWETQSEHNNNYFEISQSTDGTNWRTLAQINGAGNSSEIQHYTLEDYSFDKSINYYKISQVDFNGDRHEYPQIIAIDNTLKNRTIERVMNLMGQPVTTDYQGIVIVLYSDGSTEKNYQN